LTKSAEHACQGSALISSQKETSHDDGNGNPAICGPMFGDNTTQKGSSSSKGKII
jgi:hypothetical protein